MYRREYVVLALIVAFIAGFVLLGWLQGYPRQAILFPTVTLGLAVVFAGMRVWETRRKQNAAGPDPTQEERAALAEDAGDLEIATALVPFLWVFAALGFLWLMGFLLGLSLYVLAFLLAHGIRPLMAVAVAVGTAVFVYVVFQIILGVLLPVGLIPDALGI